MSTPDLFLVMRYGQPDRFVSATFAKLAAGLGVRLRPVLPWTEWASVDGNTSILRVPSAESDQPIQHSEAAHV